VLGTGDTLGCGVVAAESAHEVGDQTGASTAISVVAGRSPLVTFCDTVGCALHGTRSNAKRASRFRPRAPFDSLDGIIILADSVLMNVLLKALLSVVSMAMKAVDENTRQSV